MHAILPKVFQWIIENDTHRKDIATKAVVSNSERQRYAELRRDKRYNLVPGAENVLRWNTNKGEPA